MRTVVIYHGGGCFDGFCAAWVLRRLHPDAEFVAAQYGEPPPDVAGSNVVIADFSYKRPVMLSLAECADSLTVLDHHKTAAADLDGLEAECVARGLTRPTIVFDMGKSGGRLAWEHAYDRDKDTHSTFGRWVVGNNYFRDAAPWLVDYTEDRDLWRWALPFSREINAGLRSYPMTFDGWDAMAGREPIAWLMPEGRAILRAEQQTVDTHVRHAREIDLAGHKVLAVNATTLTSDIAGALAAGRPFGVCYFDRADGMRVWSLRSRDGGVDVSAVATLFGGGGHRNAAGFQTAPGVSVSA